MKRITIIDWNTYGDYMMFANIVSDQRLGIILQVSNRTLTAMGNPERVDKFCEELTKNKIPFKTE